MNDGCAAEHSPASNARCDQRPADETDQITVTFPSGIEATFAPGDTGYPLAQEIERLRADLLRAERVCAMAGWTAADGTERGKALTQVWMEWAHERPSMTEREAWPDLSDEGIAALAAQRDQTRAETLAALRLPPGQQATS